MPLIRLSSSLLPFKANKICANNTYVYVDSNQSCINSSCFKYLPSGLFMSSDYINDRNAPRRP